MHWIEEVTQALIDAGYLELFVSSRYRVYPLDATQIITLATGGAADQWGSWTEVIPAGLIPFTFAIRGIRIETISGSGIFHIQLGSCDAGQTPGANDEEGEVRLYVATVPLVRASELIEIGSRGIEAGKRIMGRTKSDTGGESLTISVIIRRYIAVSRVINKWSAFPW
jgi:hypothetical protein